MKRRNFLKIAGVTGIATALGLGSLLSSNPITQEEYGHTQQTINELGLTIDEEHSDFKEGSETIIVYLPDVHTLSYAFSQRKRIKKLDQAIDFDIVGLEGIVGSVDVNEIKDLLEQRGRFWDENTIKRFDRDPDYDYGINNSDSNPIKLQKLRIKLDEAIDSGDNNFISNPSFQSDLRAHSKDAKTAGDDWEKIIPSSEASARYHSWSSFQFELGMLKATIPQKEGSFKGRDPVSEYIIWKEFQNSEPRINAPGVLYFDLETRASKFGFESANGDDKARDLVEAYEIHINTSKINQSIEKVCKEYEKVKANYSKLGTEDEKKRYRNMEDTFKEFISFYSNYVKEIEDHRDELLSNFSPEIKEAILKCKYDFEKMEKTTVPAYDRLVIKERSEQWVKNVSSKRKVMMIGGAGHTDTVYDAAKDEKCSIISLKQL